MKTERAVSAGGVILDREGRVILTARRSFKGGLQWGLPKGIVEEGEAILEAAAREAREETGLEVEVIRPLPTIDYWFVTPGGPSHEPRRIHKFVHFFLMRATGGDASAHDLETVEVVALEPDEALNRASFPSEREVMRAALEAPSE